MVRESGYSNVMKRTETTSSHNLQQPRRIQTVRESTQAPHLRISGTTALSSATPPPPQKIHSLRPQIQVGSKPSRNPLGSETAALRSCAAIAGITGITGFCSHHPLCGRRGSATEGSQTKVSSGGSGRSPVRLLAGRSTPSTEDPSAVRGRATFRGPDNDWREPR